MIACTLICYFQKANDNRNPFHHAKSEWCILELAVFSPGIRHVCNKRRVTSYMPSVEWNQFKFTIWMTMNRNTIYSSVCVRAEWWMIYGGTKCTMDAVPMNGFHRHYYSSEDFMSKRISREGKNQIENHKKNSCTFRNDEPSPTDEWSIERAMSAHFSLLTTFSLAIACIRKAYFALTNLRHTYRHAWWWQRETHRKLMCTACLGANTQNT